MSPSAPTTEGRSSMVFNDSDNLLVCSYMNNNSTDNVNNNSELQMSRPPLSPSPTKNIIPSRKSTTANTTNCEDNISFNMSSSTSIEDNDCGDSLNNSMSLTDLHNTTPTNRTHNTISSNINSTSDLSILPIKESSNNIGSSSNNLMIRKTSSSIDYDSYNKSCTTCTTSCCNLSLIVPNHSTYPTTYSSFINTSF